MTNPSTHQKSSISSGNMKKLKISQTHEKRGTPEMRIVTDVFEWKSMLMLQNKKEALQECLELLTFLDDVDDNKGRGEMAWFRILSMAGTTARLLASSDEGQPWWGTQSGLSREPQQHSENRWFENVEITADVWQKWRSSPRGKTCAHQPIS